MSLSLKIIAYFLLFSTGCLSQNFDYKVDKDLRNNIRKTTWNELKSKTPERERVILNFSFLGNNLFNKYRVAAKNYGYNPENLVTATTFLHVISNEIIEGRNYSKPEIDKLYNATEKDIAELKVLTKQELQSKSDKRILTAMWLFNLKELTKGDLKEVITLAKETLKEYQRTVEPSNEEIPVTEKRIEGPSSIPFNDSSIYDIRMRTITSYGLSGPYVANRVYVFFKNGDLFLSPHESLNSYDIVKSKREHPSKWQQWKENNGVTTITYKSRSKVKQTSVKKWFDVRKPPVGYRIEGVFDTVDPFGGGVVVKAKTIYLNKQGKFAWKTVSGGSYAGSSVYKYSKAKGTYKISGHTIEFTYLDGTKNDYFFAIYPDSDRHLIIGKSHFVPNKKSNK